MKKSYNLEASFLLSYLRPWAKKSFHKVNNSYIKRKQIGNNQELIYRESYTSGHLI